MKWKILYFEDDQQNIDCLCEIFINHFDVVPCIDVMQYENFLRNVSPQLILSDVRMPVMDGYELFDKIQESPYYNNCPILFISGDSSPEVRLESHRSGAVDFLSRDLSPDEMIVRIASKIKLFLQTSLKITIGNLKLDYELLKIYIDTKSPELTLIEMRILTILFRSFPSKIDKMEVIRKVWGKEIVKMSNLDVHISSLRSKLKEWNYQIKVKGDLIFLE